MSTQQESSAIETTSTSTSVASLLQGLVEMSALQAQHTKEIHRSIKRLVTEHEKEQRKQQKTKPKRTVKQKPVTVTADMQKFLQAHGGPAEEGGHTRQSMMKVVSSYIKAQKLQLAENKKQWKSDATLTKLFKLEKGQTYSFMNINGLLSRVVQPASS